MSGQHLLRRLRMVQRVACGFGILRLLLGLWGAAGAAFTAQILLTFSGYPGRVLLQVVWIGLISFLLFLLFRGMIGLRDVMALGFVTEKFRADPQDQFLTAAELASEDLSDEFRLRAVTQAEAALPADWVKCVGTGGWRPLLGGAGLSALMLCVAVWKTPWPVVRQALWPFFADVTGIESVSPGNAVFPRGDNVEVTVKVSTGNFVEPMLVVRGVGDPWETRSLVPISPGRYTTVLRSLNETLEYRVLYQRHRSPRYRLTPFDPSKLIRLRARVTPPDYARQKSEVFEDVLSLRLLAGSVVRWSLETDPMDSDVRVDGENPPVVLERNGGEWSWTETVDKNSVRRVWVRRSNGAGEALIADLVMEAVSDSPPQVILLGPSDDFQADAADQIPVTAELTDDVGLSLSGVSFRVNGGAWRREEWRRFAGVVKEDMTVQEFDLKRYGLSAGDGVEFYVYARDLRRPPGEGRSEVRRIAVVDTSAAHEKVLAEMETFRNSLAERLAEQRELRDTVVVSTPRWGALLTGQRQVARRLSVDANKLKALLDHMDEDPMTLRETLLTYQGLVDRLDETRAFSLAEADRALTNQDPVAAESAMNQAVAELEKMVQFSAEAARSDAVRHLRRDQGELANMAENMAHSLEANSALSAEESRQMRETARAMEEALNRIRERVEMMQKEADASFLKNAKVEVLRFDRVSQAFSRLSQALQANDAAGALAAAKEALEHLKEMERQLSLADQSAPGEGGPGSEEIESMVVEQAQLALLIKRQEALLDQTLDLEEKFVARRLSGQPEETAEDQRVLGLWEGQNFAVNKSTEIAEDRYLTDSERAGLPGWAEDQKKLAVDTDSLSTTMAATAQRTAFLSPTLARRLSSASVEMDGASQSLRSLLILSAQRKQEKALELLREAHEKLSHALQNMQSLSQGGGAGKGLMRPSGGSGEARGTAGEVNLPRADEFRPPMEFRREILDSMKESYPKDQEAPVRDYYRHWTK